MKKRVAYVGIKGLPSRAGSDRVVEAIVQNIDLSQYQPIVYCSRRAFVDQSLFPDVELIVLPTLPGKHLHAASLFLIAAFHSLIFGDYDLVHLHNVEASFILPLLRLRYRVISTSHGPAQAREKWGKLAKYLIKLTEYTFTQFSNICTSVSFPSTTYYEQRYKREVHYIPNGVADEISADQEAAMNLLVERDVRPGRFLLFSAGRVIPTKGCHFLLQAFNQIDTDLKLIVVGDSTQLPEYTRYLLRLADDRVHFFPFIREKETLFGLVRKAHLFVFPSTIEAMSMMLLEVATLGTPIICSDIPENLNVLPDQALYFESENVADLRAKLIWALEDQDTMKDLATIAQEWVLQNYGWCKIIPQYQDLYQAILTGPETESSLMPAVMGEADNE